MADLRAKGIGQSPEIWNQQCRESRLATLSHRCDGNRSAILVEAVQTWSDQDIEWTSQGQYGAVSA